MRYQDYGKRKCVQTFKISEELKQRGKLAAKESGVTFGRWLSDLIEKNTTPVKKYNERQMDILKEIGFFNKAA